MKNIGVRKTLAHEKRRRPGWSIGGPGFLSYLHSTTLVSLLPISCLLDDLSQKKVDLDDPNIYYCYFLKVISIEYLH